MNRNRHILGAAAPGNMPPSLELLMSGQTSVARMRALRPLPEDATKMMDDAVVRVGLDRLAVVADLIAEGLTFNLGQDFWGVTTLQWDSLSESGGAQRTMDPEVRGEYQMPDRTANTVPIYLTWDDFRLGIRTIAAGQRSGVPIDTGLVEQATRRVNEGIEDAAINGASLTANAFTTPGILNAPNVNTVTYETSTAWDDSGKTGQEIIDDVLSMMTQQRNDRMFGPYNLYVNTSYGNALNKNFGDGTTTFDTTIRERIERIQAGGRGIRVREADQMPANRTALVQMTSDVIDVVVGQQPAVVSWDSGSGWTTKYCVLACMVPRVKTTYDSQSGICTGNI